MTAQVPASNTQSIDMHVHIVGTGVGGTGCWLRISSARQPMVNFMLHHIGLPASALSDDFDRLYVERLLQQVRESSLAKAVILAHDNVYDETGKIMAGVGSFYVPNEYVLALARKHPEFLPAVSIHPARPDAMEELERCLAGGAVMMKCLPNCHNINCNDPRYTRFWERMAEAQLPLLAHTGGEHTVPIVRAEYSNPQILESPLQCGVKVIAAHCATKSGLTDPEYFFAFREMTQRYSNLFGDNSAFNVPIRGRHVDECLLDPLADRLVHGSDYPVPVFGHWAWMRGAIDWKSFRRCEKETNILEKDYQLKIAMGFKSETFIRIWNLLRTGNLSSTTDANSTKSIIGSGQKKPG